MDKFYRVANTQTNQGLWYDQGGNFTGLIHNEFSFCKNCNLPMPYDKNIVGWLSATRTLDELYQWFPLKDIERLQEYSFYITLYEATKYKQHDNHWVICQETSKIKDKIVLY